MATYRSDADLAFLKQCQNEDLELLVSVLTEDPKDSKKRLTETLTSCEEYKQHYPNHNRYYYWPIIAGMTFPTIIWCFDWQDRLGLKFNKNKFTHQGALGWLVFLTAKALHISLAIVLPILLCPQFNPWLIIFIYCLSQMSASLVFVILILGTHWAKAAFYQAPIDRQIPHGSTQHAFNTTLNWRLKSATFEYWLGGLNLHLAHHIYPRFSHRHYQHLTTIIRQIAKQYGIDYQEMNLQELFKQ